jgi:hypothetical protein
VHRTRPHQFTLLYESEHAGQSVFDDPGAILIHFAPEADRVRDVAPHRCARLFKFPDQKRFFSALRKQRLDRFEVRPGHGKNVRRSIDQRPRKRLTAHTANVYIFFFAHLYRIETWRLAAHCVHASRDDFDVLSVPEQTKKKPFCDRAAANIACTNKEDAFHDWNGASERNSNLESNLLKSIWRPSLNAIASCSSTV